MARTDEKFTWFLWMLDEHNPAMTDEFVADGYRVQWTGNMLVLCLEAPGTPRGEVAKTIAEKYVEALRRFAGAAISLHTEEEFLQRINPPFGATTLGASILTATRATRRDDHDRWARAVRAARDKVACADPTLRQCYDFLDEARREEQRLDGKPWDPIYKAMEVLERRFDESEAKTVEALGPIFKRTKRAANDVRHIPRKGEVQSTISDGLIELARETIRAYERYLLKASS